MERKEELDNFDKLNQHFLLLKEIICTTDQCIFVKDAQFKYIAVSPAYAQRIGMKKPEEIIGKSLEDLFEDASLIEQYKKDDLSTILSKENKISISGIVPNKEGVLKHVRMEKYAIRDKKGNLLGIMGKITDVTQNVLEKEHFSHELNQMMLLSKDDCYVALLDLDSWKVIDERFRDFSDGVSFVYKDIDEIIKYFLSGIPKEEDKIREFYKTISSQSMRKLFQSGKSKIEFEYPRVFKENNIHWIKEEINLRLNPENQHLYFIITIHNIEKLKLKEKKLKYEAERDGLTNLLNRKYTLEKCNNFLKDRGEAGQHAFLLLDVDNFKVLNDTQGHQVGDQFLISMARTIENSFRENDVIGRLGGDEFLVLMKNVHEIKNVEKKATEIIQKMRQVCKEFGEKKLSVSIGISIYPESGKKLEELYFCSDKALYQVKGNGKDDFKIYSEE